MFYFRRNICSTLYVILQYVGWMRVSHLPTYRLRPGAHAPIAVVCNSPLFSSLISKSYDVHHHQNPSLIVFTLRVHIYFRGQLLCFPDAPDDNTAQQLPPPKCPIHRELGAKAELLPLTCETPPDVKTRTRVPVF